MAFSRKRLKSLGQHGQAAASPRLQACRLQVTRTKYPSFSKLSSISPWKARLTASPMRRGRWMFFLLYLLLMARQLDHLLLVLADEITSQGHHTGRKFVVDAAAGRAQSLDV